MSGTIWKVAVAGLVHGHIGGLLNNWKNHERAEIVAVADRKADLVRAAQERHGIASAYADWREMLEREEFDILQIGADNRAKTEMIIAAARAGKAVTAEKPLAVDLAAACEIRDALRESGTPFLVNWPTAWNPGRRTITRLVKEGAIGDVFMVKDRMGHAGPRENGCGPEFVDWLYDADRNGGGAGADFCGYGAATAASLLGRPQFVLGTAGNLTKDYEICDDNAAFIARYPKAIAVIEGTWSQQGSDGAGYPLVYGKTGTLSLADGKVRLDRGRSGGVETIDPDPLPEGADNHARYFINCIEGGTAPQGILNIDTAFIAQEIVEAGYASVRSGQAEPLV